MKQSSKKPLSALQSSEKKICRLCPVGLSHRLISRKHFLSINVESPQPTTAITTFRLMFFKGGYRGNMKGVYVHNGKDTGSYHLGFGGLMPALLACKHDGMVERAGLPPHAVSQPGWGV